jgi:Mn2+/Fe2+ NRAMP family transporter
MSNAESTSAEWAAHEDSSRTNTDTTLSRFLKTLGPGLLFASTAIGVSHLVQSTRAGASYSYALLWAIVVANLLKYPAFEAAPR